MTAAAKNRQVLTLNGSISSYTDLPPLKNIENTSVLEIHFGPNIFLNSTGIRDWILWLRPVSLMPEIKIEFYECSFSVILLVNMISNFKPANGKIISFYVPFFSENTGESKKILMQVGVEVIDGKFTLPKVNDSEGHVMELDVDEKKFFKFLKD